MKLVRVFFGEGFCTLQVDRFADDFVGSANRITEGVVEAFLDQTDGEVGDVDADPTPAKFLGGVHRGAATAERVEDEIVGVAAGRDDPFEQGDGLLRRVAEAFSGLR